ncbi:SDR family oxidoreductase [Halosimplex salinum]|uniref:SDR family oxidoreductase n=1 Tax=Halosimplex salinum TaxID=1710538 RepID=UPI000F487EB0|nr:SDR family oxidoreductase [Halosimplex salinum]
MTPDLKPLEEQVMVITGASSGNGLATARMAADRGASLVLAARSEEALDELTHEIADNDGDAVYVVADVSERSDVEQIAAVAEETYGGFDTWVNNAGRFVFGRLDETPIEDMRNLFEVNVWGALYGSLVAAEHLRDRGGAILNVGSIVSDRAMIVQGAYSASKHALKGFTDTLRMELEEEGAPVSVTLVKPAAIDTPYPEHAKNNTDSQVTLPPPVYAPETVARAICHAAETPERDLYVGGAAKNMAQMEYYAPGLLDTIMEKFFVGLQQRDRPPRPPEENAFDKPSGELRERGDHEGYVMKRSLYTRAATSGLTGKALGVLGIAAAVGYGLYRSRRGRKDGGSAHRIEIEGGEERGKRGSIGRQR